MLMERILEHEIMYNRKQAVAYAKADFSASNQWYVNNLVVDFKDYLRNVIDIGCGPADVPIRLAKANPYVINPCLIITAIDGSAEMIRIAKKAVRKAGLEKQIKLVQGYMPGLAVKEHSYDAILSKDLLHHLPEPMVFWYEIKRLGKQGALIYVMDLFRPETPEYARTIVDSIAAKEDPILKEDFYNSFCAAFTSEEVKEQIKTAGLNLDVYNVSEIHMLINGIL